MLRFFGLAVSAGGFFPAPGHLSAGPCRYGRAADIRGHLVRGAGGERDGAGHHARPAFPVAGARQGGKVACAMARITRFPAGEGNLPVLPPSDYDPLPGLEEALRTLDDLLRLLDCARARGGGPDRELCVFP